MIDRSDAEDLLNEMRSEIGLDKGNVRFPRKATCLSIYSRCVNAQASDMSTGDVEQIEEERRLFYVALTRAKDFLEVCFPLRYYQKKWSDRHSYAQLTRFLPESVLDRFERISHEPKRESAGSVLHVPATDVRRRITSMWA